MTEGLVPLPEAHWRAVWREQAASFAARREVRRREGGDRCRGCGHGASGWYPFVGLSPTKDGYLCRGCWERTYGGAA